MRTPAAIVCACLIAALPAFGSAAQVARGAPPQDAAEGYGTDILFGRLDGNDNGILDRAEADGWQPLARHFAEADGNHDLQISRAEFEEYRGRWLAAEPVGPTPRNAIFPDTRRAGSASAKAGKRPGPARSAAN